MPPDCFILVCYLVCTSFIEKTTGNGKQIQDTDFYDHLELNCVQVTTNLEVNSYF